jgi:N-(2-amino-2-carboxyethyl)-L-glutamate synthase
VHYGILTAIGNTPLVRLDRVIPEAGFRLFAKLEALNPGGSSKDRPAVSILRHAWDTGTIDANTVVVESSSGNMAIGLAQACLIYGLRFICVVDPKATRQNIRMLEAYGAEVDLVELPDPVSGEFLQARIKRVKSLLTLIPGSYWTNQYANEMNSMSHYATTMHEIASALKGEVDYLFCATSTCGTLRGCSEYVRDHGMRTQVLAVDAVGSLLFSDEQGRRLIPGIGAGMRPGLLQPSLMQRCVHVTDLDCVIGCRRLVQCEGILAGGSSGGVLMAVDKLKHEIPPDATCVMILADRGERYLDTIYSDPWVREQLGEVGILHRNRPVLRRSDDLGERPMPAYQASTPAQRTFLGEN